MKHLNIWKKWTYTVSFNCVCFSTFIFFTVLLPWVLCLLYINYSLWRTWPWKAVAKFQMHAKKFHLVIFFTVSSTLIFSTRVLSHLAHIRQSCVFFHHRQLWSHGKDCRSPWTVIVEHAPEFDFPPFPEAFRSEKCIKTRFR